MLLMLLLLLLLLLLHKIRPPALLLKTGQPAAYSISTSSSKPAVTDTATDGLERGADVPVWGGGAGGGGGYVLR